MKLYMFRTVRLSIVRSLFTVHSAMVYVIQVCRQLSSRNCSKVVYKLVWRISLLSVQWINSWWWTEELSEKCRFSCQNEFMKLVHLVGFIIKKNITTKFKWQYRGADKSLARPTSRCILFDGENVSFDVVFVYIHSTNTPPIMIINKIYEN
jgi:hypothetical protein